MNKYYWRVYDEFACAELRRFHDSIIKNSAAARAAGVAEIVAIIRAHPKQPRWPTVARRDEEYELRRYPFETRRDGVRSPGE